MDYYLLLTLCFAINMKSVTADLPNVGASSIENGKSLMNGMNNNGDCRDYTGRSVQHGMHFVPPGADICKLCVCDNGQAKSWRSVLCTPPSDCKSFQMGTTCCEFFCLDSVESPSAISSYFQHVDRT
ncbi:hypothetical protein ACKWTF_008384 [Chironomus riparius]